MLTNKLIIFFIFFNCTFILSQNPNLDKLNLLYPNEGVIYLNSKDVAELKIYKNKLTIVKHKTQDFLILNSNLSTKNKKIRTDDFIKTSNIKAYIKVLKGKKYHKKKITKIDFKSEHDEYNGVFYDNSHYYNIDFSDVNSGDIVTISYDEEYLEPRFFGSFYIGDYYPVIKSSFQINYPNATIDLKIKEINNQNISYNKTEVQKKKQLTINYLFDTIKPLKDEDYDPSYKGKASYILLSIKNYKGKDSTVEICGSLKNLYTWNKSLLKNTDLSSDDYLKKLTDSLTAGLTSDLQKLEKIYYWVQNHIAYLAYEDGLGGYIPREASLVCNRKFGDCKDMANLIVNMGKIAKLPVYHTWIGTRDIPYQFTEFASPSCANHMIACYVSKTDTIFLDATGKFHPFKLPTSMIQGKEGLVGISNTEFIIAKVPIIPKNLNIEKDSVMLTILKDNVIEGIGYFEVNGYQKILICNYLDKNAYEQQKKYFRAYFEKGNNKFTLDTFYITQNTINNPLKIIYKFKIYNYLTQTNNLTLLNLNFNKDYFDKLHAQKRKYDISFLHTEVTELTVNLNLDTKYKIDFLPENVSSVNNLLSFNLNYKKINDNLIFKNTISIDKIYIGNNNFKNWDVAIESYKKTKSNLLSLINK